MLRTMCPWYIIAISLVCTIDVAAQNCDPWEITVIQQCPIEMDNIIAVDIEGDGDLDIVTSSRMVA